MPSPEQIYQQVVPLTADLVGLSVCNHQNFPSLRDVGRGVKELSPPYTFFLLNDDMKLNRNRQFLV